MRACSAPMRWDGGGQVIFSNEGLTFLRQFEAWIERAFFFCSESYQFPPMINAAVLQKIDYFRSFPQLVNLPVTIADSDLQIFSESPLLKNGRIDLGNCESSAQVLTPACCYHLYPMLSGMVFSGPSLFSVSGPCFRNEETVVPYQRMRAFTMQEIVCVGSADDVARFLLACRVRLVEMAQSWGIPHDVVVANDPFFGGKQNPRKIMQQLSPVKHELCYVDHDHQVELAVSSFNRHRTLFGDAFDIGLDTGVPASTGCFAFGIERWLFAFQRQFGDDVGNWPDLALSEVPSCVFS